MKKCIQWVGTHPGAIAALAVLANFAFAATHFERGGYFLILSALHVCLALFVANNHINMVRAIHRLNAEHAAIMRVLDELERQYLKTDPNDWRYS